MRARCADDRLECRGEDAFELRLEQPGRARACALEVERNRMTLLARVCLEVREQTFERRGAARATREELVLGAKSDETPKRRWRRCGIAPVNRVHVKRLNGGPPQNARRLGL